MNSLIAAISKRLNNFTSYIPPISDASQKPRKVLMIRAHPVEESFSASLAVAAERGLLSAGHDVRVKSLYLHQNNHHQCYAGVAAVPFLVAARLVKIPQTG